MTKEVLFVTFQDVKCPAHRAWNQLQFGRNLEEVHGAKVSSDYFERLSKAEKLNVMVMATRSLVKGEDFVIKELSRMAQEK